MARPCSHLWYLSKLYNCLVGHWPAHWCSGGSSWWPRHRTGVGPPTPLTPAAAACHHHRQTARPSRRDHQPLSLWQQCLNRPFSPKTPCATRWWLRFLPPLRGEGGRIVGTRPGASARRAPRVTLFLPVLGVQCCFARVAGGQGGGGFWSPRGAGRWPVPSLCGGQNLGWQRVGWGMGLGMGLGMGWGLIPPAAFTVSDSDVPWKRRQAAALRRVRALLDTTSAGVRCL